MRNWITLMEDAVTGDEIVKTVSLDLKWVNATREDNMAYRPRMKPVLRRVFHLKLGPILLGGYEVDSDLDGNPLPGVRGYYNQDQMYQKKFSSENEAREFILTHTSAASL